jgi:uncharacterized membrane protein YraQ (UPF0718 family)
MPRDVTVILITAAFIGASCFVDRCKTWNGLNKGAKMLNKLLPHLLLLLALVSVFLGIVSPETLMTLLGKEAGGLGVLIAALVGSIALIPGPIAYPLAGMLLQSGVSYTVLATFITTLMMVGVLTFPVEKVYLGVSITIIRNVLSFIGALLISILVGVLL